MAARFQNSIRGMQDVMPDSSEKKPLEFSLATRITKGHVLLDVTTAKTPRGGVLYSVLPCAVRGEKISKYLRFSDLDDLISAAEVAKLWIMEHEFGKDSNIESKGASREIS